VSTGRIDDEIRGDERDEKQSSGGKNDLNRTRSDTIAGAALHVLRINARLLPMFGLSSLWPPPRERTH
jgi:hypothetical protein